MGKGRVSMSQIIYKNALVDGELVDIEVRDIKKAVEFGIPKADAFYMASTSPADYMGIPKGRIETGYDADFIAVDKALNVVKTVIDGRLFYDNV